MTVKQLAEKYSFEVLSMPDPDKEIKGGYCGDLLSWVMGRAEASNVWLTIMTNMNIAAAARRQYSANQLSFAFLTSAIITLQAKRPDRNADRKPSANGNAPTDEAVNSPPTSSRKVSPSIGTSTIRKENCAITSLLTPQISPVEMVVPERERPGITAKA